MPIFVIEQYIRQYAFIDADNRDDAENIFTNAQEGLVNTLADAQGGIKLGSLDVKHIESPSNSLIELVDEHRWLYSR